MNRDQRGNRHLSIRAPQPHVYVSIEYGWFFCLTNMCFIGLLSWATQSAIWDGTCNIVPHACKVTFTWWQKSAILMEVYFPWMYVPVISSSMNIISYLRRICRFHLCYSLRHVRDMLCSCVYRKSNPMYRFIICYSYCQSLLLGSFSANGYFHT